MITTISSMHDARAMLASGSVLAYPTEAVYGLGCYAHHANAVERLLALKRRSVTKGLILLIHDWEQLTPLISHVSPEHLDAVRATWPGPVTWIFPKAACVAPWLSGAQESIAIRMTAHPVARALCLDAPLVSTSANLSGQEPARDQVTLLTQFPVGFDGVVEGALGQELKPSMIFDVLSGARLR